MGVGNPVRPPRRSVSRSSSTCVHKAWSPQHHAMRLTMRGCRAVSRRGRRRGGNLRSQRREVPSSAWSSGRKARRARFQSASSPGKSSERWSLSNMAGASVPFKAAQRSRQVEHGLIVGVDASPATSGPGPNVSPPRRPGVGAPIGYRAKLANFTNPSMQLSGSTPVQLPTRSYTGFDVCVQPGAARKAPQKWVRKSRWPAWWPWA